MSQDINIAKSSRIQWSHWILQLSKIHEQMKIKEAHHPYIFASRDYLGINVLAVCIITQSRKLIIF